jgi:hypothetical protein
LKLNMPLPDPRDDFSARTILSPEFFRANHPAKWQKAALICPAAGQINGLSEYKWVEHSSLFVPARACVKEADEAEQNSGSTFAMPPPNQSEPTGINSGINSGAPYFREAKVWAGSLREAKCGKAKFPYQVTAPVRRGFSP